MVLSKYELNERHLALCALLLPNEISLPLPVLNCWDNIVQILNVCASIFSGIIFFCGTWKFLKLNIWICWEMAQVVCIKPNVYLCPYRYRNTVYNSNLRFADLTERLCSNYVVLKWPFLWHSKSSKSFLATSQSYLSTSPRYWHLFQVEIIYIYMINVSW